MLKLIAGLVLFLGAHAVPMLAGDWRERVIARVGENPWKLVYSVVSLVGFVLIVLGYAAARQSPDLVVLYTPPLWLRHLTLLLMVPVFVLLLAAYLPGRIQRATKHPMLLAVKIWAFAHLLANGTLPDVLLFGSFLTWAVADRISLKRRVQDPVPGAPPGRWNDWIALGGGLLVYILFLLWLHQWLSGKSPIG